MSENFEIVIINKTISRAKLSEIADSGFGNLVKGVVDVEQKLLALNGELHADEEAVLLDQGSKQQNLWGINLYPDKSEDEFIEFDSMINIRPSQNNKSHFVEDAVIRQQIIEVINKLIL